MFAPHSGDLYYRTAFAHGMDSPRPENHFQTKDMFSHGRHGTSSRRTDVWSKSSSA